MKELKIKNLNKGFTLMEVLLVIGLFSIVASLGLFVSLDSYNNSSFHNERGLLVSALMRARSQAINNVCLDATGVPPCTDGKPHGVHIDNGVVTQYILFQGSTYSLTDATNEPVKTNYSITSSGANEVIFQELSANVAAAIPTPVKITLQGGVNESSDISIGLEGQISWTN